MKVSDFHLKHYFFHKKLLTRDTCMYIGYCQVHIGVKQRLCCWVTFCKTWKCLICTKHNHSFYRNNKIQSSEYLMCIGYGRCIPSVYRVWRTKCSEVIKRSFQVRSNTKLTKISDFHCKVTVWVFRLIGSFMFDATFNLCARVGPP